jgi:hypothetical protein
LYLIYKLDALTSRLFNFCGSYSELGHLRSWLICLPTEDQQLPV